MSDRFHKVRLVTNNDLPEGAPAQGFDVNLFIDDEPFAASKITIVAEAGRTIVKAIVEFGVSNLELGGLYDADFLSGGHLDLEQPSSPVHTQTVLHTSSPEETEKDSPALE